MTEDKVTLRRQMKMARTAISDAEAAKRSASICASIRTSRSFHEADVICSYYPLPGEVDVRPVMEAVLQPGTHKRLALPRVLRKGRMDFFEVESFADLEKGSMGIMEPVQTCRLFVPEPSEHLLILVPGLAFCELPGGGIGRLGYGQGFYDRWLQGFLKNYSNPVVTCAVAYECQVTAQVLHLLTPLDQPLMFLITEELHGL